MAQLFANVSLANTFNVWRIKTNQVLAYVNKSANTTGISNLRSANLVATNITTLSGPVTISGNTTWSAARKTISGSNTVISSNVTHTSTGALKLPAGTTAQRGLHSSVGHFRYNTSLGAFEGYTSAGWRVLIPIETVTSTYVANTRFQAALANTNSYIATKVNTTTFNSALANTNSYIATKVNTTTFNSALANTNAYLANTNAYIATKYSVTNVEAKFVSNTYAQATFSTVSNALDKTNTTEQTVQASVVVANTFIAEKGAPIKTVQANTYTLLLSDNGKYIRMANTGGVTITIPNNSTVAFNIGAEFIFVHSGGNNRMTFSNSAGVTLNSRNGVKYVYLQHLPVTLKKVAINEFDLAGV
jgi:hypothetical protein